MHNGIENNCPVSVELQVAILYINGDIDAAKEALKDMPPRAEEELDLVCSVNLKCLSFCIFYINS